MLVNCVHLPKWSTHTQTGNTIQSTFSIYVGGKNQWLYPTRKIAIWIRLNSGRWKHWHNFDITDITRYFGIMWVTNGSFNLYLLGQHRWGIGLGETLASANEPGTPYRLVVQKEPPHEVRPVENAIGSFLGRKIQVIQLYPVLEIMYPCVSHWLDFFW